MRVVKSGGTPSVGSGDGGGSGGVGIPGTGAGSEVHNTPVDPDRVSAVGVDGFAANHGTVTSPNSAAFNSGWARENTPFGAASSFAANGGRSGGYQTFAVNAGTADGDSSAAFGSSFALGAFSFAAGRENKAHFGQFIIGEFAIDDAIPDDVLTPGQFLFKIGGGADDIDRKDVFTVDTLGKATAADSFRIKNGPSFNTFSLDTFILNSNSVAFIGDSIVEGKGQGGTTISKGSWVYRSIAKIRTNRGSKYIPISYDTALPPNLRDNDINRDSRWSSTAGWIMFYAGFAGNLSNGDTQGACFRNASTTNPLTLTPGVVCDTFEVYLGDYPANGQLTLQGTGGPLVSVDTNKVAGWSKVRVPCAYALATNTLTIIRTGGGGVNLLAVRSIDSQRKSVAFHNLGIGYSRAYTDWYTTTTFDDYTKICTSPGMDIFRPDAAILALGVNDAILGTTTANFITAITNLVSLLRSSAGYNIAFASPPPPNDAVQRGRIEAYMLALRSTFPSIPMIDFYYGVFGGVYVPAKMTDTWHPNSVGSEDMAQYFANWLTAR